MQPYLKACLFQSVIRRRFNLSLDFHLSLYSLYKKIEGSNPLVVNYDYCPPVSLVDGSAISPSSAGGSTTVSVGGSVTPSAAAGGSSSTVIVNDSCVVCRRPSSHTWPMAVHVTRVSPIGNVSPDSWSQER
jgi:hypothetical protein